MCELATVYACEKPKARKQHECCECRGVIQIGETYHKHHGLWDSWSTYKVCNECEDLRTLVDAGVHGEDITAFGELWESVFESREPHFIKAFMTTRRGRGAKIEEWMTKREQELCV